MQSQSLTPEAKRGRFGGRKSPRRSKTAQRKTRQLLQQSSALPASTKNR